MSRTVKLKLENLPAKLRAVRNHLGLSQSQLAARLTLTPHYGRVSEYERGRRVPSLLTLLGYARLGGIHVDDLIDDSVSLLNKERVTSENTNGFDTSRRRLHAAAVQLTVAIAALDKVVSALLDVGEELKKILDDAPTTDTG